MDKFAKLDAAIAEAEKLISDQAAEIASLKAAAAAAADDSTEIDTRAGTLENAVSSARGSFAQ